MSTQQSRNRKARSINWGGGFPHIIKTRGVCCSWRKVLLEMYPSPSFVTVHFYIILSIYCISISLMWRFFLYFCHAIRPRCCTNDVHLGQRTLGALWDEVELRISPEELHNSNLHFSLVFHSALYLWSHSPWYQSWTAVVDPTPIPQHHTQFVPEPTAQSTLAWLSAQLMQALEWPRRGDFVSYLKNCSCFYLRLLFCFVV